ncbi:RNA-directed RNA polymerase [Tanacetum coccineum]
MLCGQPKKQTFCKIAMVTKGITQISKVALKDTGTDTVSAKCKAPGANEWPDEFVPRLQDFRTCGQFCADSQCCLLRLSALAITRIIICYHCPIQFQRFDMRYSLKEAHSHHSKNLLAIAAGVKQKDLVDKIITKFLQSGFIVMVFHYDGIVDQWNDLGWVSDAIHVSAVDQTKWYLTIVKEEGLDLSQPALDRGKSGIHHHITAHRKNSKVHSWVEMMVPVFSKAAWRCAWYLIQGDRKKKVGVVDAEYIVHLGLATLGGSNYKGSGDIHPGNDRVEVRKQSYNEMHVFRQRWHQAVKGDKCWIDRYRDTNYFEIEDNLELLSDWGPQNPT